MVVYGSSYMYVGTPFSTAYHSNTHVYFAQVQLCTIA